MATSKLTYDCQVFKQGKFEFVLFVAKAKDLWQVVTVNRREEEREDSYQRACSPTRTRKIASFIDSNNAIPLSVFVSFDEGQLNRQRTKLTIPQKKNIGWVIDGQHRLSGASVAEKDILLPVVATIGLSTKDQIEFFITINKEQVGVPSSLYYDLLPMLPHLNKSETEIVKQRASDLSKEMRRSEDSPFFNRITFGSPKKGQISVTNFIRKIHPMLKRDGILNTYNDEDRAKILGNFYQAFEHVFPKEYQRKDTVFFKTVGFGALMNLFPMIFNLTIQAKTGFRVADVVSVLDAVKEFDFDNWHQMGSGNSAETQAADQLRALLEDARAMQTIPSKLKL